MEEAEFVSDEAPSTSGELEQSLGPYHEMIDSHRECITGYMHGIDSFSFNDSFYKDENRVRRFRNSGGGVMSLRPSSARTLRKDAGT